MIWILTGVVLVLIIVNIGVKKHPNNQMPSIVIAVLVVLVVYIAGNALTMNYVPADYNVKKECNLANLRSDTAVEGKFFLGSGTFEEEPCIFYCREVEGGGWQLEKVKAEDAVIYEGDREDGSLIVYSPSLLSSLWSFYYDDRYEFFIPEGSIIREYTVR